jgi:hypothetical protein
VLPAGLPCILLSWDRIGELARLLEMAR